MSVAVQAFKGASWLAVFKFLSQLFSWVVTIIIARILLPEEYGLYAIAFLITGYAQKFSQLGLGAAIIQRPDINKQNLSSVFWFSIFISILFAVACIPISYLTAHIFNDPRTIPLTQSIAFIFILSGLQIVPLSLLRKELAFKTIGQFELVSVFASGVSMLLIAYSGGGVWTLIAGRLIFSLVMVILLYSIIRWLPLLHYNYKEAKSFIKFGITVSLGGSLYYISDNVDRYFAGKTLGVTSLGYYSFALQLAQIPTEKIVVLINQVSYSAFAKLQDDEKEFNRFYLNIIKVTGTIVMPIFFGGFMLGGDLVEILLGEKWLPIISIFELLCLAQIIIALNAYNNFVHNARAKPKYSLLFNFISAVIMGLSFYIAAQYGLEAMVVPWFTSYLGLCIFWIAFTLKELNILYRSYINALLNPLIAALLMSLIINRLENLALYYPEIYNYPISFLLGKIFVGSIVYILYFWIFDREAFYSIKKLKQSS